MIPSFTDLNDLIWLNCLISRAALRVQELQQFLKRFGVRGVMQESALALYMHEVFRFELVEMVGQG
jgi:hypothetical protein